MKSIIDHICPQSIPTGIYTAKCKAYMKEGSERINIYIMYMQSLCES